VEVPSAEDAAAVRRSARERRERSRRPTLRKPEPTIEIGDDLNCLIDQIDDRGRVALTAFAAGLAAASSAELIARAERIAHNFRDVADAQGRSGRPRIEGEGT
jgi:hypothetical protein